MAGQVCARVWVCICARFARVFAARRPLAQSCVEERSGLSGASWALATFVLLSYESLLWRAWMGMVSSCGHGRCDLGLPTKVPGVPCESQHS